MPILPIFNLKAEIENYNNINNTHYKSTENFGFVFFKAKLLKDVQGTIGYINQGVDAGFFTEEEKNYLALRQQLAEDTKAHCEGKSIEKPKTMIADPVLEERIQAKEYYLTWLKYQHEQLTSKENWEQWINSAVESPVVTGLSQLKKQWEAQQAFAYHTNAALLEASELLALLIKHYQVAVLSLPGFKNRLRVPSPIYNAYSTYLNEFLQYALEAQKQCAEAMLARLKAWDKKQLNTIAPVVSTLEKGGAKITHAYLPLPLYTDVLTHQQINAYHHYIVRQGDEETQQRLHKLSWLKPSAAFPTVERTTAKQFQLIPESLASAVPNKKRKPAWLYKGANLRHDFFNDKTALLATFKQSPNISNFHITLEQPLQWKSRLAEVRIQAMQVNEALAELTDKKYSSLSFFQRQTKQFLSNWQGLLLQHRHRQVENKIVLAEKLSAALKAHYENSMNAAVYAWQACEQLRDLVTEIQADIIEYQVDRELTTRLERLQDQHCAMLSLNRVFQAFQSLAAGDKIDVSEFSYLHGYMDMLKVRDNQQYDALLQLCLAQRLEIYMHLRESLKHFFKSPAPKQAYQHILCLNLMTKHWGEAEDKVAISSKLKKFFLRYLEVTLQAIADHKNVAHNEHLILAETMLQAMGQEVEHAGETLAQHVVAIQALKQNPLALKCRCLALALPLSETFLKARWESDARQLDENIQTFIFSAPTLGYEPSHVRMLMQIRDRAVQENKPLEELQLKKAEQVMVGLTGEETGIIKPLISASIQAHQTARQINGNLPLKQKTNCLKALNLQMQSTLHDPSGRLIKNILGSASGRRLLFSKPYINAALLPDELSNPSTEKRFTSN